MNRLVTTLIIFVIMAIWISAMANACAPSGSRGGFLGPAAPIFIGSGGGWNQGGWNPGSTGGGLSSPGRSSGGFGSRGGGITGGFGGK